jgi:hypothetical protein
VKVRVGALRDNRVGEIEPRYGELLRRRRPLVPALSLGPTDSVGQVGICARRNSRSFGTLTRIRTPGKALPRTRRTGSAGWRPGTGKSRRATVPRSPDRHRRRVRFTTPAALVNQIVEAEWDHSLGRMLARWSRVELIIIAELDYVLPCSALRAMIQNRAPSRSGLQRVGQAESPKSGLWHPGGRGLRLQK